MYKIYGVCLGFQTFCSRIIYRNRIILVKYRVYLYFTGKPIKVMTEVYVYTTKKSSVKLFEVKSIFVTSYNVDRSVSYDNF